MKTYPNGSKCGYKEMDKIKKERDQILWGSRRLHSQDILSICRREVKRFLATRAINIWQHKDWILEAIQQDLGFTDAQIETQLKNLCKYTVEKRFIRKLKTQQIIGTEYRYLH